MAGEVPPLRASGIRAIKLRGTSSHKRRPASAGPPCGRSKCDGPPARRAFACGAVAEAPGLLTGSEFYVQVDANKKRVKPKVSKETSAVHRHRRWLKELSRQRAQVIEAHENNEIAKAERLQKFYERAAKQRADVRATTPSQVVPKRTEKPFVSDVPGPQTDFGLVSATFKPRAQPKIDDPKRIPDVEVVDGVIPDLSPRPGVDVLTGGYFDRKYRMCEPESRKGTAAGAALSRSASPFKVDDEATDSAPQRPEGVTPLQFSDRGPVTAAKKNTPVLPSLSREQCRNLPPWARTENQQRAAEEAEVDDLLQFAENLDFDDYIDDLEVQANLAAVKQRVERLKAEEEVEQERRREEVRHHEELASVQKKAEALAEDCHENITSESPEPIKRGNMASRYSPDDALKDHKSAHGSHAGSTRGNHTGRTNDTWEMESNASTSSYKSAADLLKASRTLRNVHSKRSMGQVVQNLSDRVGFAALPVIGKGKEQSGHPAIPEPTKVCDLEALGTISLIERRKMLDSIEPGTIPYLYRHPAV